MDTGDRLLTPGEVAALFRVDPKTVTRWAAAGRIGSIRTPGGHRRFRESEVRALLEGEAWPTESGSDDAADRPADTPPDGPLTRASGCRGHPIGRCARVQLAGPARNRVVRDAERVEHLARHEVDQLLGGGPGARAVEAGAGRQHHRAGVVQRDQVLQVAAGHRGLARHDHDRGGAP